MTITLQPSVLEWARKRMRLTPEKLAAVLKVDANAVVAWESNGQITHTQLEKLAKATRTPRGYLFLSSPPQIKIPLADYRTVGSKPAGDPSPELLEMIFGSQRRQDWFRSYQQQIEADRLGFVGSCPVGLEPQIAARRIREALRYHPSQSKESGLDGVLRECIEATEALGVLVIRNGVVGNNGKRKLSVAEFRGFALADDLAPLIFINGADFKAAQIFTWIHELAHIFAGVSALSNTENTLPDRANPTESFCNAVAAEYLVPTDDLRAIVSQAKGNPEEIVTAVRLRYRVSDLVVVRRLYDIGEIPEGLFRKWYLEKLDAHRKEGGKGGGNFYSNQRYKIGPRFGRAVVASTLEGGTLYRDALGLLGLKSKTFNQYAERLGFQV